MWVIRWYRNCGDAHLCAKSLLLLLLMLMLMLVGIGCGNSAAFSLTMGIHLDAINSIIVWNIQFFNEAKNEKF